MHQPLIDLATVEGRAIATLHDRIRWAFGDDDGDGWNGGDLVEMVERWLRDLGIDPDADLPEHLAPDAELRYATAGQVNALLAGATDVGEHRPDGFTITHRSGIEIPVTCPGIPQAVPPGEPAGPGSVRSAAGAYSVDLSAGGAAWYRIADRAAADPVALSVADALRDGARFTSDGQTFHLAYPSGLCARLTPASSIDITSGAPNHPGHTASPAPGALPRSSAGELTNPHNSV